MGNLSWARAGGPGRTVDDFGGQEPGSAAEIKSFCQVNFDVDFPLTEKVHVKGEASHPLFAWLRQQFGRQAGPRWNSKYLIGPDGLAAAAVRNRSGCAGIPAYVEPLLRHLTAPEADEARQGQNRQQSRQDQEPRPQRRIARPQAQPIVQADGAVEPDSDGQDRLRTRATRPRDAQEVVIAVVHAGQQRCSQPVPRT